METTGRLKINLGIGIIPRRLNELPSDRRHNREKSESVAYPPMRTTPEIIYIVMLFHILEF